jgi:hypothetical protein
MSIKKYLARIDLPDPQPGPFAVRLKYELRKELFERRPTWGWYPAFSTGLAGSLMILLSLFVVRPHWASALHASLFGQEAVSNVANVTSPAPSSAPVIRSQGVEPGAKTADVQPGERMVNGIALPDKSDRINHNVVANNDTLSTGSTSFPALDADKSYLIRRIPVSDSRSIYYISELKADKPKIIY